MPVLVDHEKTRKEIALLAIGIIANEGIAGLTTRRMAEVAGTSRGIVSTYFRDMRDLTLAAFGLMVERQVVLFEEVRVAGGGLRECVEALLPIDDERLVYWRVVIAFYGVALADPELAAFQQERIDGGAARFERIIMAERGLTRSTPAVKAEAQRIISAIIGESIHVVFHGDTKMTPARRRQIVSRVVDGPSLD